MARTTKTSKRIAVAAKRAIRASKKAALVNICVGMHTASVKNGNRLLYSYITRLLKELQSSMNWLNRYMINKAFLAYKEDFCKNTATEEVPNSILIQNVASVSSDHSGSNIVSNGILKSSHETEVTSESENAGTVAQRNP